MAKKGFLGAAVDVPQYEEIEKDVTITADNITDYFTVTNGDYYFEYSGGVFASNNYGINSSTATTVLTAKQPISNLRFSYSWSSESNYDKFTLKIGGLIIEDAVSGATTTKHYTTDLADGGTIEFIYSKDSSQSGNDDVCTFFDMNGTFILNEQTGVITTQNVARAVKNIDVGTNDVKETSVTYEEPLHDVYLSEGFYSYGFNGPPAWDGSKYVLPNPVFYGGGNIYDTNPAIPDFYYMDYDLPTTYYFYALADDPDYRAITTVRGTPQANVARKVKKGWVGVNGVDRMCFGGTPVGELAVGSVIQIKENGTPVDYLVVHQGNPNSTFYDDSCDGTWLLRKDIAENRMWNNPQENVLEASDIHTYLNVDWLNRYDNNVKESIKQVKIPYRKNGGQGGTNQYGITGLSCKVFLLSAYEVGFTNSGSSALPVEGIALDYFDGGSDATRSANFDGSAADWWLRSPVTTSTTNVFHVRPNGTYVANTTTYVYGIRPCIILPSDFAIEDLTA